MVSCNSGQNVSEMCFGIPLKTPIHRQGRLFTLSDFFFKLLLYYKDIAIKPELKRTESEFCKNISYSLIGPIERSVWERGLLSSLSLR